MSFTSLLIETCTVQRYTEGAADNYGVPAKTWADHLTDQACRINATTGREVLVGAKVVVADYKMFIADIDITEQDRVVSGGVTYEVLLVSDRQNSTVDHHKECLMKAVR